MEWFEWTWKKAMALGIPIFGILGISFFLFGFANTVKNLKSTTSAIVFVKGTSNTTELFSPFDEKWQNLVQLECAKLFDEDETYTNKVRHNRIVIKDPPGLDTKCDSIYSRWNFPKNPKSGLEADFPIAFARTVFKVSNYQKIYEI